MAQDFGDDMGNALLNFVTRQTENYLRFGRGRERAFDWWQRHYKKEGNTPEAAKAMAEKQSSREQVVVPFGTSEEAAYYAHGGSTRYDRCQEPDGYGDEGAGNHAGAWFEPAL